MRTTIAATLLLTIIGSWGGSDPAFASADVPASGAPTASPWPGGTWNPPEARFGTGQDLGLSVRMSDGVDLKVDVSYPTDPASGARAPGPFPVLLTQSPYLNDKASFGDYFVQRGYIYVTAHVRGTRSSGGSFSFFAGRDAQDGAELVRWVAGTLQGSSGTVGLHGDSYRGLTQFWTVAALGPGSPVKAMVASCSGADFYSETYFAGGIPTQTLNFQRVIGASMGGDTAVSGADNVANIMAGGERAYFGEFWKERTLGRVAAQVAATEIPILMWSSNGDIYAQSSLDLYAYLQNARAKRPVFGPMAQGTPASGRYQIVMGQGGHCANQNQRIHLEWFETWLKGARTGMADTGMPIHVHELGSNRWFNTSHYPVVPTYTPYFLDQGGALRPAAPTITGAETGEWSQPSPASTVQYETSAFPDGGTLAGPVGASVFASSSTTNLELIATLQMVSADGTVVPLSSGTVLGSMSENDPDRSWFDAAGLPVRTYGKYDADREVSAGTVRRYDFTISPRFVRLPHGSKLRVVFTTQTPVEACSPRLGTDPCFPTVRQAASLEGSRVTIHHGPSRPSSLNFPLLASGCWRSADNPGIPFWTADAPVQTANSPCQQ